MKIIVKTLLPLLMLCCLVQLNAQQIPVNTFYAQGVTKPTGKQYESHDVGVTYFINLALPDVEQAPATYRRALSAMRDTVLNRTVGHAYIKGDKDYKKLLVAYVKQVNESLTEMMTPFEEEMLFAYKWYIEISGMADFAVETPDPHSPFFSFYLSKIEMVGNTFLTHENLVFDRKTGQLLTIDDLLDLEQSRERRIQFIDLMIDTFRQAHPKGSVDYEDNINDGLTFEIDKSGMNFYIPTDNLKEPVDYIYLSKTQLMPYVKKGGLLDQYWNK